MSDGNGFLLPSWYKAQEPRQDDMNIASLIWGFSLSCAMYSATKAVQHSWKAYRRGKLRNTYIIMVWSEWSVCVIISILSWLYLTHDLSILPGFWIFFGFLVLWTIQSQCILQIIINRVRLLMDDQQRAAQLKWGTAIFVGLINISVFVIWIPARLQLSEGWMHINDVWDRIEKVLLAMLDIILNLYFVHLIRTSMIANGLKKYKALFRFNICVIFISMSLDEQCLPNSAVCIQFHPLVYLIKLHIEMNIAELIAKIVKETNHLNMRCVHIVEAGEAGSPLDISSNPKGEYTNSGTRTTDRRISTDPEAAIGVEGGTGKSGDDTWRTTGNQVVLDFRLAGSDERTRRESSYSRGRTERMGSECVLLEKIIEHDTND